MSKYCRGVQICSVCGTENSVVELLSTNTLGPMDLDTRPSEMMRTDAFYNVHKCKKCGYVAYYLSSKTKIKKEYLNTISYKKCDQVEFSSKFSELFYKMYLISLKEYKYQNALWNLLRCAWSTDDIGDIKKSIVFRKKCIELLDSLKSNKYNIKWTIIKIDLLRRSQQFDKCKKFIKELKRNKEVLDKIYKNSPKDLIDKTIKLQIKLCNDSDDRCYNINGELSMPGDPLWYLSHTKISKEYERKRPSYLENSEEDIFSGVSIDDPAHEYIKEIMQYDLLTLEQEKELVKEKQDAKKLLKEKKFDKSLKLSKEEAIKLPVADERLQSLSPEELAIINNGEKAQKALINRNLRLVVSIAKRYIGHGLSLLDLIQEGNLGLACGIEKFDYKMGFKLSTYVTWWIRQAVSRALADQSKTIRIPVHMVETIKRLNKVMKKLTTKLGYEPTIERIAKEMKMSKEKVEEVMRVALEPLSFK